MIKGIYKSIQTKLESVETQCSSIFRAVYKQKFASLTQKTYICSIKQLKII